MKKKYSVVLIDLDDTLWDFQKNSREALKQLYSQYTSIQSATSFAKFLTTYHKHNDVLWRAYREGRIEKNVLRWKRFNLTLKESGINSLELAKRLDQEYLDISKMKTHLVDGAVEVLHYLKNKYFLCLVTNGFNEVQFTKISNSGLDKYFNEVITSEMAGCLKPDPAFYRYTLERCHTDATDCILIGDNPEADIAGARNAGIDQIYFSPTPPASGVEATFHVKALKEIMKIL